MDKIIIESLVDDIVNEYKTAPIDLLGTNGQEGEMRYMEAMKGSYVQTIEEIMRYIEPAKSTKILEIGAFLGVLSIGLSRLGFDVYTTDIPEFISNKRLQDKLEKENITFKQSNLSSYALPWEDNIFDFIIMCEVIEHLNFNPVPVIREINRISKLNALFYLSHPNHASLANRVKLLLGRSIHHPIDYYFQQLDPQENMIVGIHWREYTGLKSCRCCIRMDLWF